MIQIVSNLGSAKLTLEHTGRSKGRFFIFRILIFQSLK